MIKKNTLHIYRDKRVFSIFLLGIVSGLPWVMIGSALTLWLKEYEVSRTEIGYAALIYAVYAINFFWSPLIDRTRPWGFRRFLSKRQSWILPCQLGIVACCFAIYFFTPEHDAKIIVLLGLFVATLSATQDIAIDAYRIDSFSKDESEKVSAAAATATAGWWTGYAGLGYIPLRLSDSESWSWGELYLLLGGIMLALAIMNIFMPAPRHSKDASKGFELGKYLRLTEILAKYQKYGITLLVLLPIIIGFWAFAGSAGLASSITSHAAYVPGLIILSIGIGICAAYLLAKLISHSDSLQNTGLHRKHEEDYLFAWLLSSVAEPISDFFRRNGLKFAVSILLFIFLFKIGEAFLGRMSIVFYKEVGFTNTDIATYSKMLTWWVTIISAILAGALNARFGLIKGLFISGAAMALSNLMFIWIATIGPSIPLYIATIVIDGFAAAWSTVAFVAFISALCSHSFSATQYALLASLGALGRTLISSMSGQLVDALGGNWQIFFILTILMIIPSMIILLGISRRVREIADNSTANPQSE